MGSYLSVSHNGEPATGEEPKQFRFMGLPPETRKQVYVHLLCPEPDIRRDGEGDSLEIAGLHETAILYVNRQVHEEARDVLLRANEFVRVLTSGLKVTPVLPKVSVRVVAHSPHSHFSKRDAVVRNFRGAVMSYVLQDKTEESGIRERDIPSVYPCDMLIRARDVDEFVRGVADPSIRGVDRLLTGTTHRITIHDPFRPQPEDSNYTNIATQKRLLQPFQKHYQGFADVNIQGEVDTALASSVLQSVHYLAPTRPRFPRVDGRAQGGGQCLVPRGRLLRGEETMGRCDKQNVVHPNEPYLAACEDRAWRQPCGCAGGAVLYDSEQPNAGRARGDEGTRSRRCRRCG